jgi:hypothetical protein
METSKQEIPGKRKKAKGRNPTPENEYRKHRVTVRFSEDEWKELNKKMASVGNSNMAAYIRSTTMEYKHTFRTESKSMAEALVQVKKLGANINQIARAINSDKGYFANNPVKELLEEIDEELKEIYKKL